MNIISTPSPPDPGVQPERTAFGWERTALAGLGAGLILTRSAAKAQIWIVAVLAILCVTAAGTLLAWASVRYTGIHGSIASGEAVSRPRLIRLVGAGATVVSALALTLAAIEIGPW